MAIPVQTVKRSVEVINEGPTGKKMHSTFNVAPEMVMKWVVNQYTAPFDAVVREYLANAIDATIESGSDQPVEVTTPTMLDPYLVIADHGVGMTYETTEQNFLSVGASTKTDSNELIGQYGTGAKSAWMIADSFLIVTVKNGVMNKVRASSRFDETGLPAHDVLVENQPTDLPDGTTVSIPVEPDAADWEAIVRRVASAHRPGAVVVDGQEIASIHAMPGWIGPVLPGGAFDHTSETVCVVSGGTLFGLPPDLRKDILARSDIFRGAVIRLPLGSYELTSSREQVVDVALTRATISAALAEYAEQAAKLTKRINKMAETDPAAAIAERAKLLGKLDSHDSMLPINGRVWLPLSSVVEKVKSAGQVKASVWRTPESQSYIPLIKAYEIITSRSIMVTGIPEGKSLRNVGRYMDNLALDNRHRVERIITLHAGQTSVEFPTCRPQDETQTVPVIVTPAMPGLHVVGYEEFTAEATRLAAEHRAANPSSGGGARDLAYNCQVVTAGSASDARLTLAEIADMRDEDGYTVAMTESHYHDLWKLNHTHNVVVIIRDGRKEGPILKALPETVDVFDLTRDATDEFFGRVTDATLIAAWVRANDKTRKVFKLAHRIHAESFATEPVNALTRRMAKVYADGQVDGGMAVEVSEAVKWINHLSSSDRIEQVGKQVAAMAESLVGAYPMLPITLDQRYYYRSDRDVRFTGGEVFSTDEGMAHLIAYVRTTPPVVGEGK